MTDRPQDSGAGTRCETFVCETWAEFRAWVSDDKTTYPRYWRGQEHDAWPVASKFEREVLKLNGGWRPGASHFYPYDGRLHRNGKPIWDGSVRSWASTYLSEFQQAAHGLRGSNPATLTDLQWLALGRHFGLITPLLDWTESPYIAAFFALTGFLRRLVGEVDPGGPPPFGFTGKRFAAVYRLVHHDTLEDGTLAVVRPKVEELGRLQAQRGLFTQLESEEYFELEGYLRSVDRLDLLSRATIPDVALLDGLRDLNAHGIDYRLLFPDLQGAADHANAVSERRWLARN